MLGKKETATLENNGKRSREVFAAQVKQDFKDLLTRLVDSKLDANELLEVFANTGLMVPVVLVQNILVARYAKYGDNSEQDAIARGEQARASSGAPNEAYFTKRQMQPMGPSQTKYASDVEPHKAAVNEY
jgi:hypothetical protein